MLLTDEMGAGGYCERLAQSRFQEAVLDWLDETLESRADVPAPQRQVVGS